MLYVCVFICRYIPKTILNTAIHIVSCIVYRQELFGFFFHLFLTKLTFEHKLSLMNFFSNILNISIFASDKNQRKKDAFLRYIFLKEFCNLV